MLVSSRGRLKTLIFLALLLTLLVAVLSFLYFRAGPRAPEGADIVRAGARTWSAGGLVLLGTGGGWGLPRSRAWAVGVIRDLKYIWGLEKEILGRSDEGRSQLHRKGEDGKDDGRQSLGAGRGVEAELAGRREPGGRGGCQDGGPHHRG